MFRIHFLIFGLVLSLGKAQDSDERIDCEPQVTAYNNPGFWNRKYKVAPLQAGWYSTLIHRSKTVVTENAKLSDAEKEVNNTQIHTHFTGVSLYETTTVVPLGKYTSWDFISFYHGDNVVFHIFDEKKKTYRRAELGFHVRKYFIAIEPYVWFTIEFEDHGNKNKFASFGFTVVRGPHAEKNEHTFADRKKMIEIFPEQAELLKRITK